MLVGEDDTGRRWQHMAGEWRVGSFRFKTIFYFMEISLSFFCVFSPCFINLYLLVDLINVPFPFVSPLYARLLFRFLVFKYQFNVFQTVSFSCVPFHFPLFLLFSFIPRKSLFIMSYFNKLYVSKFFLIYFYCVPFPFSLP